MAKLMRREIDVKKAVKIRNICDEPFTLLLQSW